MSKNGFLAAVFVILLLYGPVNGRAVVFAPEKAGFAVRFKSEVSPYRVAGVFVLPGETIPIEVMSQGKSRGYTLEAAAGDTARIGVNQWTWTAPRRPGLYPARIIRIGSKDSVVLNLFVMVPYERLKRGKLNGYWIGAYPAVPLKGLPIYRPPKGFVEVTEDNENTLVVPHFRLGQFVCKQEGGYPKYAVLRERLLLNLELILQRVNEKGYRTETFQVMSGYRTPSYNRTIGNGGYSRHLWGGAADIFIDQEPRDGAMDDLNRDGTIDHRDAAVLYRLIDSMHSQPLHQHFIGGLSKYKQTPLHGPFVHVDVRGFRARW